MVGWQDEFNLYTLKADEGTYFVPSFCVSKGNKAAKFSHYSLHFLSDSVTGSCCLFVFL